MNRHPDIAKHKARVLIATVSVKDIWKIQTALELP